ncbi:hypothetical protein XA68_12772 [Ophiocordyceps unilateralis]|uniref:Uncharacterized protein n=1 Tax=Ophiocordyceps unilateralis TaxID=268505 RepID=A0A2A9PDZ5_OPHUN|nr:hypothetical protein XA68_12772 [Ophiocordyceps unilateralis]
MRGPAMRRQMLRSTNGWARLTTQRQQSLSFSTSQWLSAEGDEKPSIRQQSRAAVGEISSMLAGKAEEQGQQPSQGTQPQQQQQSPGQIIDMKMLPRGMRRRGGVRGGLGSVRGGLMGRGQFSGAGRGRGGFRGGRRGGRKGQSEGKEGEEDEEVGGRQKSTSDGMTVEERALDRELRFGTTTVYEPYLTMEDLTPYVPPDPSTEAGQKATVLQELCLLAGGNSAVVGDNLGPHVDAQALRDGGMRYFADLEDKEAAEEYLQMKQSLRERFEKRKKETAEEGGGATSTSRGSGTTIATLEEQFAEVMEDEAERPRPIIQPADESVRKAVMDRAILGDYEKPTFATDPIGIARSWHLRSGTYLPSDVESFERKLQSLLGSETNRSSRPRARSG